MSSSLYRWGVVRKSILCITTLLALGTAGASAEEMATAPSAFITTNTPYLAWSGLYGGINGGYGWGNSGVSNTPDDPVAAAAGIPSTDFHRDGGLAGGQLGYNWQFNSLWLAGIEADYQWSDFSGTGNSSFHLAGVGASTVPSTVSASQHIGSFGTLRARMGVIATNALLLYGTGGLAVAQARENLNLTAGATGGATNPSFSYSCVAGTTCFTGSSSKTLAGYIAGTGVEYAVTSTLTFKTEILYMHLESSSARTSATAVTGVTTPASFTASYSPVSEFLLRGGLNLRF
jgi:outer membrane immunogenic protein